ncbi:MAG: CDP-diacylglycerol--serine O-phosphatidyltransferase [Bacteroidetes bacterium]|nr:CDP-diacylglycerol--serine O-phosphatidyltransferase [Bacteroidota bacterium]
MKKHIPNSITLMNLLSGCIACTFAFNGEYKIAFLFMLFSLFFDFMDGLVARLLKSYSDVGKELDSLADMVSFGFLPSLVMYTMGGTFAYFAFFIAMMSALRLAKFNVDTREHDMFYGLATPANAVFFVSVGYLTQAYPESILITSFNIEWVRMLFIAIFSLLLVSNIPMYSLKLRSIKFKDNIVLYSYIIALIISIIIFRMWAIPFAIITYVLLSVITSFFRK